MSAQAQLITLSDGNSSAAIDPLSQKGMYNWSVDGVNQLYQQWFWYGIGNGSPQSSIDTLSAPSINILSPASAALTYQNASLSVQISYTLTGGSAGSGNSNIGEAIHLMNLANTALTLRFYQYSDFDLMGSPVGDSLQLYRNLGGNFYEAIQSKGNLVMSETDLVPGASHGEASAYPTLLTRLNGGSQITLADNTGLTGPGDAAWAFEWDITLDPGASFVISKNKQISLVPEPATLALLGLGLGALVFCRRRAA